MRLLTAVDWLIAPTVLLCYYLYRRWTQRSLDKIRGPKSVSFVYGNLPELLHAQAGQTEFKWYAEYGPIVKFNGIMGAPMLLVADAKALHHIFQASGYGYPRDYMRRMLGRVFGGRGLTVVEGEDHKRQRRIMQPSFGASETKALLPIFSFCATKMASKWTDLLNNASEAGIVLDFPSWISRATLDAIGLAAFDYDFGALDNADNELSRSYRNMFKDIFHKPSKSSLLVMGLFKYLPEGIIRALLKRARSPRMVRLKQLNETSRSVSQRLVKEKTAVLDSTGKKDVMTQIVKANSSENPKSRLDDMEMYSMMQTVLIAGHETTANTLGWLTMELTKHPEIQTKLRHEIQATEMKIQGRGDSEFTTQDFESMPYLTAVVKETLRLHPALAFMQRTAGSDDVLPLSKPIVLKNGEVADEVLIPKGTTIIASIAAYNRTPEIFGSDAHIFNPDRWMKAEQTKEATSIGVYANLFTFSGGIKSCIGWRFAVMELHAFIVSIFGKFELSLAVDPGKIRREACGIMVPTIEGEEDKGCQLPVRVKLATS